MENVTADRRRHEQRRVEYDRRRHGQTGRPDRRRRENNPGPQYTDCWRSLACRQRRSDRGRCADQADARRRAGRGGEADRARGRSHVPQHDRCPGCGRRRGQHLGVQQCVARGGRGELPERRRPPRAGLRHRDCAADRGRRGVAGDCGEDRRTVLRDCQVADRCRDRLATADCDGWRHCAARYDHRARGGEGGEYRHSARVPELHRLQHAADGVSAAWQDHRASGHQPDHRLGEPGRRARHQRCGPGARLRDRPRQGRRQDPSAVEPARHRRVFAARLRWPAARFPRLQAGDRWIEGLGLQVRVRWHAALESVCARRVLRGRTRRLETQSLHDPVERDDGRVSQRQRGGACAIDEPDGGRCDRRHQRRSRAADRRGGELDARDHERAVARSPARHGLPGLPHRQREAPVDRLGRHQ